jgi:hypothetical protein
LIGGQAVNYWAEHYLADEPGVTAGAVESLAIGAEWSGRHIRVLVPIFLLLCKVKLALLVCAYNFCKFHSTLGCTPAVGLKLATEAWTIEKLIEEAAK